MDFNALNAAKAYGSAQRTLRPQAREAALPQGKEPSKSPADFVKEMGDAIKGGEQAATNFMVGKADPHTVVEALASAELAVETAVTLRNRAVEAYQELMRMPV